MQWAVRVRTKTNNRVAASAGGGGGGFIYIDPRWDLKSNLNHLDW